MPEGKIESEERARPIDWYENVLREHSAQEIQEAIAKALSDLTGQQFDVSLMNIDFAPEWAGPSAEIARSAECVLRIRPDHEAEDDDSAF